MELDIEWLLVSSGWRESGSAFSWNKSRSCRAACFSSSAVLSAVKRRSLSRASNLSSSSLLASLTPSIVASHGQNRKL